VIDWKSRFWCFLVDCCFKRTIFVHIKRLLGLFWVFTIIESFGWGFYWLFDIDDLIFFSLSSKFFLESEPFVFFQVFCFCFYCKALKIKIVEFFEVLKRTFRKSFIDNWLFVLTFKRKLRIAYSVCIGIGNRLLSPIIRIHWMKRLYFFISLHWLGQSHTSLSFTSVTGE